MPTIITADPPFADYAGLPSRFATYASIPAAVATYADLPNVPATHNSTESASVVTTFLVYASDAGTISESAAVQTTAQVADSGTGSDQQALAAQIPDTDFGAAISEATSSTALLAAADTGYSDDIGRADSAVSVSVSDGGTSSEISLVTARVSDADPIFSTYAELPARFATYSAIPAQIDIYAHIPTLRPFTYVTEIAWVTEVSRELHSSDQNGPVAENTILVQSGLLVRDNGAGAEISDTHASVASADLGSDSESGAAGVGFVVQDLGVSSELVAQLLRATEDENGATSEIQDARASLVSADAGYPRQDDLAIPDAKLSGADFIHASESAQEAISATRGLDQGFGADQASPAVSVAYSDYSGSTLEQADRTAISFAVADSGISVDTAAVQVRYTVSDQGAGVAEIAWQQFTPARDSFTATEFQSVTAVLAVADMGTTFEIGRKLLKEALPGRAHYLIAVDGVDVTRLLAVVGDHE